MQVLVVQTYLLTHIKLIMHCHNKTHIIDNGSHSNTQTEREKIGKVLINKSYIQVAIGKIITLMSSVPQILLTNNHSM